MIISIMIITTATTTTTTTISTTTTTTTSIITMIMNIISIIVSSLWFAIPSHAQLLRHQAQPRWDAQDLLRRPAAKSEPRPKQINTSTT